MRTQTVSFDSPRGHALAGRLDLPPGPAPAAYALLAHCFTCGKDLRGLRELSGALVRAGWGVLRFDFSGLGHSGGEFGVGFSRDVDDVVAAAQALADLGQPPRLVVGHSLGGAAVLAAAARIESAVAVATIGAPSSPAHLRDLLLDAEPEIEQQGQARVNLAGREFTITKRFLDELTEHPLQETIGALRRALLVMHAPEDDTVGIDNATEIFTAAKHPKSFVSLAGADHLLGDPDDARFAGSMIATWATRYVPEVHADEPADHESPVLVHGPREKFATVIEAGPHRLVADEPKTVGGSDLGPTPYGLTLAGLGACTAMTLRMYADRKGWPLAHADVELSHDHVHAKDCDGQTRRLERIARVVTLHGELDETQRARLMEIADKCPVHRTLTGELEIVTTQARS